MPAQFVGIRKDGDGVSGNDADRTTFDGAKVVAQLHGKHLEQAIRGNVYYASTAAVGVVVPIYTTLTPTYSLWNPAGSGVYMVPICAMFGWNATTAALGSLGYTYTANAGASISTTAPFVAFGSGSAINAKLGGGAGNIRTAIGGTTTLVAAATWFRDTGISSGATTAATATMPLWTARDEFDGTLVVPPGNAIHVMGATAVAMTMGITIVYEEVPV
jgi:hypothetical protein